MEPTLLFNDNMTSQRLQEVKQQWSSFKQGQVFNWTNNLDDAQLTSLLEDVEQIDITEVNRVYSATVAHEEFEQNNKHQIKSFDNVTTFADSTPEQRKRWEQMGLSLISENKVGVLLLAGGQASRLGCVLPKGMYDIGLPSHKSLYQLQVERAIRVATMAAKANGKDSCAIPWYIMTSPATYEQTVKHFRDNSFFGLPESNFFFFNQHMQPCLTPEGQIINESAGKIALAPNGNGGLYKALYTSGALADMKKRGLEYVSQYCVDNCLIRVADPVFVGFMNDMQADCAAKVVPKAYPEEPVGVMATIDGKPGVVEYSEIDTTMRYSRDENGQLVYNYSHICINAFSVDFLNRIAENHLDALRFHIAKKKIPYANEQGEKTTPPKENGWKLEMFIFDAFQFSKKMVALEVDRDEEFSPLKNASGAPKDSPETCLADICRLHTKYITAAGGIVESSDGASAASPLVEVSPLVSYSGEDLAPLVRGKTFNTPVEITGKQQRGETASKQQQQQSQPRQQGVAAC